MKNGLIIDKFGTKYYYSNDKFHREDGPAFENVNGDKEWYINDQLHREDGPACEYADGTKFYYLDDIRYSKQDYWNKIKKMKNGLIIDKIGDKNYYVHGELHREDGPARIWNTGPEFYYLNNIFYPKKLYWKEIKKRKSLNFILSNIKKDINGAK